MTGIYINCRALPFVALILAGLKPWETRTRNMLGALCGQRVALIETGRGPAMVRGYATITRAERISYNDTSARRAAQILGTSYDIQPEGAKWFYRLENVEKCQPYPVPANRINHGRAWTEFTPAPRKN